MFRLLSERSECEIETKLPLLQEIEARDEASRCIYCHDAPCIQACPTSINIPQFIARIAEDNLDGAAETILESNLLGYSCAKVCPVEELCVGACVYSLAENPPIPIGRLQHYAVDSFLRKELPLGKRVPATGYKVALMGAGPASLSCAGYLALSGVQTTIYEKSELPGGLNTDGIAPYKLKVEEALQEVHWIESLGVEIKVGVEVGHDVSIEELQKEYDALFIGIGLGKSRRLLEEQQMVQGVWTALPFIHSLKLGKLPHAEAIQQSIVIGGGNTALDVAQELALLTPGHVVLAYRGTEEKMRGYTHELVRARSLGVQLLEKAVLEDVDEKEGHLHSVTLKIDGKRKKFPCQCLVFAIGEESYSVQDWFPSLEVDAKGCVSIDPVTKETSCPGVYAGGDCTNGGKEVVHAVADGREAAYHILQRLNVEVHFGRFSHRDRRDSQPQPLLAGVGTSDK